MNNSQVNNIEWKDGAVCFAGDYQRSFIDGAWWRLMVGRWVPFSDGCAVKEPIEFKDFQLNTIKQGDYISAVNMSTKSTFDKMVDVFGLFGYKFEHDADTVFTSMRSEQCIYAADGGLMFYGSKNGKRRELSVNQVEAIGELKRLELKGGNAALSSDEETELKSRAMASELNSQSNDEWRPKVGDEVCWSNGHRKGELKCIHDGWAWVKVDDNDFASIMAEKLKKPKTPEDILSEELAKKGVQDVYILACQIINGEFDSIKYVPNGGK